MARSFNGTSDRITLGNNTILSLNIPITLAAWFNLQAPGGYGQIYIDYDTSAGQFYGMNANNAAIGFQANVGSFSGATGNSNNVWIHAAVTVDASGNAVIYRNGVSDGTNTGITWNPLGSHSAEIGADFLSGDARFMQGYIADVAVWNINLSALEALALARGARPWTIRSANLKGWWPLDGLQSPEPDLSGNANNGTLTGTALVFGPPYMQFTPRWWQTLPPPPPPPFVLMPQIVT